MSPRKWFADGDPVSTAVARLCVLREDIYIELLGLAADEINVSLPNAAGIANPPGIDDNGPEYRRIYFLRASLRTLAEVRGALAVLWQNTDFRNFYGKIRC
jgi:hypothetical protein